MALLIPILASLCLYSTPLVNAFSPQPLTKPASQTSYCNGRLAAANDDNAASSSNERKPWDVFRFVSQSSKFVTPPPLPFIGDAGKKANKKVGPGKACILYFMYHAMQKGMYHVLIIILLNSLFI